jgi:AcrR family transcriptional regulator
MTTKVPTDRPIAQRRAGRSKTDVLEAAARVIVERGTDATRFSDVAAASGVPVSSLQYYFGSREDMLVAAFRYASQTELSALREQLDAISNPWSRVKHLVEVGLGGSPESGPNAGVFWFESWRFALRDVERRADVLADYAAWRLLIADAVRDGQHSGAFTSSTDPALLAIQTLALIDGVGMPMALADPELDRARAVDIVLAAVTAIVGRVEQSVTT